MSDEELGSVEAHESTPQQVLDKIETTAERVNQLSESAPDLANNYLRVYEILSDDTRSRDHPERLIPESIIGSYQMLNPETARENGQRILNEAGYKEYLPGMTSYLQNLDQMLSREPRETIKEALAKTADKISQLNQAVTTAATEAVNAPERQRLAEQSVWLASLLHKTETKVTV